MSLGTICSQICQEYRFIIKIFSMPFQAKNIAITLAIPLVMTSLSSTIYEVIYRCLLYDVILSRIMFLRVSQLVKCLDCNMGK